MPSESIWSKMRFDQIRRGQKAGFAFFDDFQRAGAATFFVGEATADDTRIEWTGGSPPIAWKAHVTSGVTIFPKAFTAADSAGVPTGILTLDIDADNDECYVHADPTYMGAWCRITDTAGNNKKVAVEYRVRLTELTATATMFGLRELTAAATLDIPDAGASIKVAEFVGWRGISTDYDGVDAVHVDAAEVVVQEAATGLAAQTLTAATWVKLGLLFDGTRTYWFCNGQCANPHAGVLPSATNFPDDEPLMPYFGGRVDSAVDAHIDVDWVKFCAWY
jgi:hypothetical protein